MQKVLNGDDAISEVFFFRSLRSFPSKFSTCSLCDLKRRYLWHIDWITYILAGAVEGT